MGPIVEAALLNLRRLADKADRYGWNVEREELQSAGQALSEATEELDDLRGRVVIGEENERHIRAELDQVRQQLAEARAHDRVADAVEQIAAIDAKVRLKYIGQIREQTERAEAAEVKLAGAEAEIVRLRECPMIDCQFEHQLKALCRKLKELPHYRIAFEESEDGMSESATVMQDDRGGLLKADDLATLLRETGA